MGEAIIVARLIGRRRKLLDDWSVSLPPDWGGEMTVLHSAT